MARKDTDQEDHDKMVRAWVKALREMGYEVKADLPEFDEKPSKVHGKVPDVEATKGQDVIIGEQETCESIPLDDTRDQFVAFTKGRSSKRKFYASVLKGCLQDLKDQVQRWKAEDYQIEVDQYWHYGE